MSPADLVRTANAELLVRVNAEAAADFFAPSYVAYASGRELRGLKQVESFVTQLRRSFSDLRVEVEVLAEQGDRVAWQRTCRATHSADFRGFPGTDKAIAWHDMLVSRIEDGKIAEEWAVSDLAEQLLASRR